MSPNRTREGTSVHSFRIDDDDWERFQAACARGGTTPSAAIRKFIRDSIAPRSGD